MNAARVVAAVPAYRANSIPFLVREHPPTVDLLLVDPAVAVERDADECGGHGVYSNSMNSDSTRAVQPGGSVQRRPVDEVDLSIRRRTPTLEHHATRAGHSQPAAVRRGSGRIAGQTAVRTMVVDELVKVGGQRCAAPHRCACTCARARRWPARASS